MEPYSLIIGLVFVALFILPIWAFQRTQNKGNNLLSKSFKQAASAHKLSVSQFDLWQNTYGIGFDERNKKLLYIKHISSGDQLVVIDLNNIDRCSIEHEERKLNAGKHSGTITEKLSLVLVHNNNNGKDFLEFYDEKICSQMNGEAILIEKWQKLLDTKLAAR